MKSKIVPNFKVPKDYRRAFYFEEPATGFRHWLIIDESGVTMLARGEASALASSRCLDWMQETIERVRAEVSNVR